MINAQTVGMLFAKTFKFHQLKSALPKSSIVAMSRLNFMEEQELVIQTIAQELVRLEQLVLEGELIAPENAQLFDSCIEQANRIRNVVGRFHNIASGRFGA